MGRDGAFGICRLGALALAAGCSATIDEPRADPVPATYEPGPDDTERRTVGRLTFAWRHRLGDAAARWIEAGEPIAADVARVLGGDVVPSRTVELVETIPGGRISGHANGDEVVVAIEGHRGWAVARTLAHELAHAAQHDLGVLDAARRFVLETFLEGVAEWVAYEVLLASAAEYLDEAERDDLARARRTTRWVASSMIERHAIDLELLFDPIAFSQRIDLVARYGLGELLAEAIVRACGRAALGELQRSAPRSPEVLVGWANAAPLFGAVRCDTDEVQREWDALVGSELAAHAAEIDTLPRAVAGLVRDAEGREFVRISFDRPLPEDTVLGVRVGFPGFPEGDEVEFESVSPPRGSASARVPLPRAMVEAWRERGENAVRPYFVAVLVALCLPGGDLCYSEPWAQLSDEFTAIELVGDAATAAAGASREERAGEPPAR